MALKWINLFKKNFLNMHIFALDNHFGIAFRNEICQNESQIKFWLHKYFVCRKQSFNNILFFQVNKYEDHVV